MNESHSPETPRNRGDHDAPHVSPVTPVEDFRTIMINTVSWGAVLAGVIMALAVHLILNMVGVGIGAATLDPLGGDSPTATSFSIGAAIWWSVSGILASLGGGYVAGRLAGRPKESTAGWHGLTAWALTTLITFTLLTSTLGSVVGSASRMAGSALGGAGSVAERAVQTAAPQLGQAADPFAAIERSVRDASGGQDPAALRDAAVSAVRAALTGDQGQADQARTRAAEAISRASGIPIDQARAQVERYEQEYRAAVNRAAEQARQAADIAATSVSLASLVSALALFLGALAAWFGGRMGAVTPTITARFVDRSGAGYGGTTAAGPGTLRESTRSY